MALWCDLSSLLPSLPIHFPSEKLGQLATTLVAFLANEVPIEHRLSPHFPLHRDSEYCNDSYRMNATSGKIQLAYNHIACEPTLLQSDAPKENQLSNCIQIEACHAKLTLAFA